MIAPEQFYLPIDIPHQPLRLNEALPYRDQKDPCVYLDPVTQERHIYFSHGSSLTETWEVWRVTQNSNDDAFGTPQKIEIEKPEGLEEPSQICAVSVFWDAETQRHQLLSQTHCFATKGFIGLWQSIDGVTFRFVKKVIEPSQTDPSHAGVYDPHILIDPYGKRRIFYTAIEKVGHGEIYEAVEDATAPTGYRRVGRVLQPTQLPFQNLDDEPGMNPHDYEWCPEGIQVIHLLGDQLDPRLIPHLYGKRLMIGAGFLKGIEAAKGKRQRLFFALEEDDHFTFIGILNVTANDESGHASMEIVGNDLRVYYQDRARDKGWQMRTATVSLLELEVS